MRVVPNFWKENRFFILGFHRPHHHRSRTLLVSATRGRRSNAPFRGVKKADVVKMMKGNTFEANDFPPVYLVGAMEEEINTCGGRKSIMMIKSLFWSPQLAHPIQSRFLHPLYSIFVFLKCMGLD
ncbi:hypothetical protein LINPERPRIM_LOCUS40660 [Linum perenne]